MIKMENNESVYHFVLLFNDFLGFQLRDLILW